MKKKKKIDNSNQILKILKYDEYNNFMIKFKRKKIKIK
jgi:hypothetical protein